MESRHSIDELRQMQAAPLNVKIRMTEERIRAWVNEYGENGVYCSFSGGKDSSVLLDIIRERMGYKNIPAVFIDVPTQYPELKEFVKTFDNVTILKPKYSFYQVCEKYGFPMISKEVSESVQGARKYLKSIEKDLTSEANGETLAGTERNGTERNGTERNGTQTVCLLVR